MERQHIGIVALPAHKEALRRLAHANGETMAVVVRRLIREEAQRRGMWAAPDCQNQTRKEAEHA